MPRVTRGTQLEAVIREVDKALAGPWEGDGAEDLRPFLISSRFLNRYRPKDLRTRRRDALKHRLILEASRLARGPFRSGVTLRRSFTARPSGPRHLFVFGFPWTDRRHTVTLRPLLEEMAARAVAVTDRADVFDAVSLAGVPCVQVRIPRFLPRPRGSPPVVGPEEQRLLARGAALLDAANSVIAEIGPVSVLTIQDFVPFDQAFARAARRRGIPTVTHQHGQIPSGPASLYKYLFSDRMAVWGQRSARLMEQWVKPERVWVVGTDRFQGMSSGRSPTERDCLVLGLGPTSEEQDRALLEEVSAALAREGLPRTLVPVLKLHPSMDAAYWRAVAAAMEGVSWEVRTTGNETLLPRARFVLARRSTLTLDAAMAGASVLELALGSAGVEVPAFFEDLPESVVTTADAAAAVAGRNADPALEATLLDRQRASLALEIEPGAASAREAAALRELER